MIPIPDYLRQYAIEPTQKGNRIYFKLKCSCGCEAFYVLEKDYSNEENRLIKEYENSIPNTRWHTIYGGIDENGNPYHYVKILGLFKKQIIFPQPPVFMGVNVIKSICSQCQREIILFDSRYHGYEGMTSKDEDAEKYIPHFKQKDNALHKIEVVIENDSSLESFNDEIDESHSFDFHSNSFDSISVYDVDKNGKKRLLYDFETA